MNLGAGVFAERDEDLSGRETDIVITPNLYFF